MTWQRWFLIAKSKSWLAGDARRCGDLAHASAQFSQPPPFAKQSE